jgi:CheY-like chemotaxis protein
VLLTDLRMPLMAGDELAAHARRMRPALPVIFMSGQAEDATVSDTRLRGETVLAKPFRAPELAALLATVIG